MANTKLILLFVAIHSLFGYSNGLINFPEIGCWFTEDFCQWVDQSNRYQQSQWQFRTTNVRNASVTGPLQPAQGDAFIQAVPYKTDRLSPTSGLITPLINATGKEACFRFYYYMFGDVEKLSVELISEFGKPSVLWQRRGSQGDRWQVKYLTIPAQTGFFKLQMTLYSANGIIALDDFTGSRFSCFHWYSRGSYQTWTFEDADMRGAAVNSDGGYSWQLIQAGRSIGGVDSRDRTTLTNLGHMMETVWGNEGTWTMIQLPERRNEQDQHCLGFWFLEQRRDDKLFVLLQENSVDKVVWSSTDKTYQLKKWNRVLINLNVTRNFIVKFKSLRSRSGVGDNIDDVSLDPGSCPKPINCDFDQHTCGWLPDFDLTQDYHWLSNGYGHGYGRVVNPTRLNFKTVPIDRSWFYGKFLYTDFTGINQTTATLKIDSEMIDQTPDDGGCLSFWYIVRTLPGAKRNDSSFTVVLSDVNGNNFEYYWRYNPSEDPSWGLPAEQQQWIKTRVKVWSPRRFRLSFKVSSIDPTSFVAIDNVKYANNIDNCNDKTTKVFQSTKPTFETTFSLKTTTSKRKTTTKRLRRTTKATRPTTTRRGTETTVHPPVDSVDCDFENGDVCQWTNTIPWLINQPRYQLRRGQPNMDHTGPKSLGRYIFVSHDRNDTNRHSVAQMSINKLPEPNYRGPACLRFWYYMRTDSHRNDSEIHLSVLIGTTELIRSGDKSNKWHEAKIEYQETGVKMSIYFYALVKMGLVAVDDISIRMNSCLDYSSEMRFRCTFEEGPTCGLFVSQPKLHNWAVYKGSKGVSFKTVDATLMTTDGNYFGVDFAKNLTGDRNNEIVAEIIKLPPAVNKMVCVSFKYLIHGLKGATDNVYFDFILNGGGFHFTNAPFYFHTFRSTFKIDANLTEAKFRVHCFNKSLNEGIIAIDDIDIDLTGPCKNNYYGYENTCDFENNNSCDWQFVHPDFYQVTANQRLINSNKSISDNITKFDIFKTNFIGHVFSPIHGIDNQPAIDHTFGNSTGTYLFMTQTMDGVRQLKDNYKTVFMLRRFGTRICLRFFYFINNPEKAELRSRLEILTLDEDSSNLRTLGTISQSTNGRWEKYKTTIIYNKINNYLFFLKTTIGSAKIGQSIIAIDDISVWDC